jgi:hypothetical protein
MPQAIEIREMASSSSQRIPAGMTGRRAEHGYKHHKVHGPLISSTRARSLDRLLLRRRCRARSSSSWMIKVLVRFHVCLWRIPPTALARADDVIE